MKSPFVTKATGCLAVLVTSLMLQTGCQEAGNNDAAPLVEVAAVGAEVESSESVEVPAEIDDPGFWQHATELYEHAKSKGETTADSAQEWVGGMYNRTAQVGAGTVQETADWVQGLYEKTRNAGQTTAANAKDWVLEDVRQMGAWEYKTLEIVNPALVGKSLTKLGRERWECFWVDKNEGSTTFYFKRRGKSYLRHIPAKEVLKLIPMLGDGDAAE